MVNELQEKAKTWLQSIKVNPDVLGAYPPDGRINSGKFRGSPETITRPNETDTLGNYKIPEPNERPAAKELNALWEDITRIREELRKLREDIRGLTQALVNTRKEASLARGGGVKQPATRSALEG